MNIKIASMSELKPIKFLYAAVAKHMKANGINQWGTIYPNGWVISKDLKGGNLHAIFKEKMCTGAVVVDSNQSTKYKDVSWTEREGKPAVIHRLAVHPDSQGKGFGKLLLMYAEQLAKSQGFTSIRLDAYMANPAAIKMYERANYSPVGQIHFPMREHPFQCFEKIL
ncbi:MAG: GNAT family N-acetyltransferase [Bacillota bacterium]|nr:GNAT family N-acetyltransferase [Bacillota bacterium]